MSGTTQAIDVIHGGVKSNALPEQAFALINHRIGIDSSSAVVEDRDTRLLLPLAEEFNLAFTAFGKSVFAPIGDEPAGKLNLEYLSTRRPLEPAPVTPLDSNAFGLLAGTIRSTFDTHRAVANRTFEDGNDGKQKEEIFVAPGMPTGNTGTCFALHILLTKIECFDANWLYINGRTDTDAYLYDRYPLLLETQQEHIPIQTSSFGV